MEDSSTSNREKVYSECGNVGFMKVYNCTEAPPGEVLCVFLSMYTATKAIRKSPGSKSNRNKICKKGRTLYVLGAVAGPDTREYLVFSEETWVFKREWAELKDLVMPAGACIQQIKVTKTGEVKDKWEMPRQSRRKVTKVHSLEVQFTNDPRSTVWFTLYGLQYMKNLVASGFAAIPLRADNNICTMRCMKEEEKKSTINWAVLHKNGHRTSSGTESAGMHIKEEESFQTEVKPEGNSCEVSKEVGIKTEIQVAGATLTGQTRVTSELIPMPCNRVPLLSCSDTTDNAPELLSPQEDYNEHWSFPYV